MTREREKCFLRKCRETGPSLCCFETHQHRWNKTMIDRSLAERFFTSITSILFFQKIWKGKKKNKRIVQRLINYSNRILFKKIYYVNNKKKKSTFLSIVFSTINLHKIYLTGFFQVLTMTTWTWQSDSPQNWIAQKHETKRKLATLLSAIRLSSGGGVERESTKLTAISL